MNRHRFPHVLAAIASFGLFGWASTPVFSQELPNTLDPQQAAIQMLEENPELVINMMRSVLQTNPGLVEQIQQNPEQAQQMVEQNPALVQYLQQHPELLEQLQQVLQEQ